MDTGVSCVDYLLGDTLVISTLREDVIPYGYLVGA